MAQDACGIAGGAMSYMQFQQRCKDCGNQWNAAFGIVGTTQIAAPAKKCPKCGSENIEKAGDGWKMFSPQPQPEMTSLRDIRQKLEALVEMRADDERWRKLLLEKLDKQIEVDGELLRTFADWLNKVSLKLDGIGNCLAGLLTLGAKPSTKRKPRGRRK